MTILSDINKELLQTTLRRIEAYDAGQIHFPQLITDSGVAIDSLVECGEELLEPLKSKWQVLEEVNALALDQDSLEPLAEHKGLAQKTLDDLRQIIIKQLSVPWSITKS